MLSTLLVFVVVAVSIVAMLLVLVVHVEDSHLALRDAINPGDEVPRQLALDMSPKQASMKQK